MKQLKTLVFVVVLIAVIFFVGRNLNPFSSRAFIYFHDETQPARIQQFALNLRQLKIPPRVASEFNNKKGYPVFNFYAPFSYWLTSGINLVGFNINSSLKLSFFLALFTAFLGTYLFLDLFFDFYPSILGAILYITSLYFPADIFVRFNLAEVWFLALFPLGFYFIYKNSKKLSRLSFLFGAFTLASLFTSHNIYSLIAIPILLTFSLLLKNKKQNLILIGVSLLLTSYFWMPALTEMKYTIAEEMASKTNFHDHFLCIWQLWQSPWGFGGSVPGCIGDGMSFKVGKIQIVLFGLGILLFLIRLLKAKQSNVLKIVSGFFIVLPLFSLFLTIYQSQFIWNLLSPFMAIIQFPWRFIGISLIGIVFTASYFTNQLKLPFKNLIIIIILVVVLITNGKYFYGQEVDNKVFEKKYLSQTYIRNKAALAIPEYFPKNNVKIDYGHTAVENLANLLSMSTLLVLIFALWKMKI